MRFEKQIEFDKIKERWSQLALTSAAKGKIANMEIILEETALKKQLRDTTDSRQMLENVGNIPLQNVSEIREIVEMAVKGSCLTPFQLERVKGALVVIRRLRDYLTRGKAFGNPLAFYDENLEDRRELCNEIERQIRGERVDDYASGYLADLRVRIIRCEEQMKQKADSVLRSNKDCMSDSFCTVRNGRICVPVKKEYRNRIAGSVIDKSATGSTYFIEPESVARYYEDLELLRIEEENEVTRILYALSEMVAQSEDVLNADIEMIEKLDFIFSKGKLSIDLEATEPVINTERRIRLKDARHPLLDRRTCVPLQFEMGGKIRGIVITGPNTGGKTVSIKTVMLCCVMAQCGLHVTCSEADVCMNSGYYSDIGDGQNMSENLSTFSAHIKNVLDFLGEVDRDSFVIMDELGSGTDPAEGMGIAIAMIEQLRKSGANFLVTTHYPEVKEYADRTGDIVNARMTFDRKTLRPTYRMVIGEAGESCAFYIADRLGMPASMLRTAIAAAYGEDAIGRYEFHNAEDFAGKPKNTARIRKEKNKAGNTELSRKFQIGDSVMVLPDKKIGIVCEPVNEQGILRVQMADGKIYINHKRVKLHVKADRLYPPDYDFSIIFDSVANRKIRHDMGRKLTSETIVEE